MYHLKKVKIQQRKWNVEAFYFLPRNQQQNFRNIAIFTHGYTSHKGSLLNWGVQLAHKNIPTLIFDLPGHYLGSFNEIEDMEEMDDLLHKLFESSLEVMRQESDLLELQNIILGGHSLGAMLSLRSASLECFQNYKRYLFPVGFGLRKSGDRHPLLSDFFKPLLDIRRELVSPAIAPEKILQWIETTKEQALYQKSLKDNHIYLITGKDDVLVSSDDVQRAMDALEIQNEIFCDQPEHLPHHQPELAIKFILRHLKETGLLPKI